MTLRPGVARRRITAPEPLRTGPSLALLEPFGVLCKRHDIAFREYSIGHFLRVVATNSISAASLIYKGPKGSVNLYIDKNHEDHHVDGLYRFKSCGKL